MTDPHFTCKSTSAAGECYIVCQVDINLQQSLMRYMQTKMSTILQVEKVKKAVDIAKKTRPDLFLEGQCMQNPSFAVVLPTYMC